MTQTTKTQQESYNTTELAADLAKKFGFSKAQALRIVTAACVLIGNAIARGALVRLHQFGNFKKLETKERQGRNPKTGEATTIEASSRPHFVASQTLKSKVKAGTQEEVEVSTPSADPDPAAGKPAGTTPRPTQKAQPARKPIARKQPAAPAPAPTQTEEPAIDGSAIDEL